MDLTQNLQASFADAVNLGVFMIVEAYVLLAVPQHGTPRGHGAVDGQSHWEEVGKLGTATPQFDRRREKDNQGRDN